MKVRLGAVSFLNTRPLVVALEGAETPFALSYAVPSVCADQLRAGQVDLGLIPAIEYAHHPNAYCIVPGISLACRGEVLSVRLFCQKEVGQLRRVALDQSSRASAALLRILLRERYHLDPEFAEAPPDLDSMLAQADAALLIGDPVFRQRHRPSLDLGLMWQELTGLPFVFALWAGRPEALTPCLAAALVRAKDEGLRRIPAIAADHAAQHGGEAAFYQCYLERHMCFELGQAEQAGLREYFRLARRHGLIEEVPELRFYAAAEQGREAPVGRRT
jgi:chorismate dehydratase